MMILTMCNDDDRFGHRSHSDPSWQFWTWVWARITYSNCQMLHFSLWTSSVYLWATIESKKSILELSLPSSPHWNTWIWKTIDLKQYPGQHCPTWPLSCICTSDPMPFRIRESGSHKVRGLIFIMVFLQTIKFIDFMSSCTTWHTIRLANWMWQQLVQIILKMWKEKPHNLVWCFAWRSTRNITPWSLLQTNFLN